MTPLTDEELRLLADSSDARGTSAGNRWAKNRWRSWAVARSEQLGVEEIPLELADVPLEELVPALTRFFTEIVDCSGNPYSGKTFHTLMMAVNRLCVTAHGENGNFMGKNQTFSFLRRLLNGRMKELQSLRRQKRSNKSSIITDEQEEALWRHAFDLRDPRGLQRAVVYVIHKTFVLRGGSELSDFSLADLTMEELEDDWVQFTYHEHRSKNHQPGLQSVNRDQKVVEHTCRIDDERDLFFVLNEYLKHVPRSVKEASDANPVRLLVHLKPNLKDPAGSPIWFTLRSIGKNYFPKLLKESFTVSKLDIEELKITLKSVKSSTITKLRASGEFTDAEIRSRTGHISDRALSAYERPSGKKLKTRLSAAIRGSNPSTSAVSLQNSSLDSSPGPSSSRASPAGKSCCSGSSKVCKFFPIFCSLEY